MCLAMCVVVPTDRSSMYALDSATPGILSSLCSSGSRARQKKNGAVPFPMSTPDIICIMAPIHLPTLYLVLLPVIRYAEILNSQVGISHVAKSMSTHCGFTLSNACLRSASTNDLPLCVLLVWRVPSLVRICPVLRKCWALSKFHWASGVSETNACDWFM